MYSETGRKVAKEKRELKKITENLKNLAVMAPEQIIEEEKKCLKIDRFVDEYDGDIKKRMMTEEEKLGMEKKKLGMEKEKLGMEKGGNGRG